MNSKRITKKRVAKKLKVSNKFIVAKKLKVSNKFIGNFGNFHFLLINCLYPCTFNGDFSQQDLLHYCKWVLKIEGVSLEILSATVGVIWARRLKTE